MIVAKDGHTRLASILLGSLNSWSPNVLILGALDAGALVIENFSGDRDEVPLGVHALQIMNVKIELCLFEAFRLVRGRGQLAMGE